MKRIFLIKANSSYADSIESGTVQAPFFEDEPKKNLHHFLEEIKPNAILVIYKKADKPYEKIAMIAIATSSHYLDTQNYCVPRSLSTDKYRTVNYKPIKEITYNVLEAAKTQYKRTSKYHKPERDSNPHRVYNTFASQNYCTELRYYDENKIRDFLNLGDLI